MFTTIMVPIFLGGFVHINDPKHELSLSRELDAEQDKIDIVQNDYTENYGKYFGYARLLSDSHASAEDLVQQTFLNIIRATEKDPAILDDALSPYVFKTIRNISISQHKKYSTQPVLRIVDSENSTPEMEFALSNDRKVVSIAISGLSITQRSVIVMHYFDNLKVREIAKELNISSSAVKTHLQRARKNVSKAVLKDRSYRGES